MEKGEGAALKDAEEAIKKVDAESHKGVLPQKSRKRSMIEGIRLDRKVKEDTEIPALARKRSFETLMN